MKKLFYFIIILIFGACSVTTEESSSDYGSSDGTAAAPVELTVGTAKAGSVAKYGIQCQKYSGHQSKKLLPVRIQTSSPQIEQCTIETKPR